MRHTHWSLVAAAAVVFVSLGFVARAVADDPDRWVHQVRAALDAGSPDPKQANAADRAFLVTAARDCGAAIELGRLAERQADSTGVRWYGRRLVGDHQRLSAQIAELALVHGVALPDPDRTHREMGTLPTLKGEEFDRAFLRHLVAFNERQVEKLNRQLTQGQAADVKDFTEGMLPTLQQHLQIAQDLRRDRMAVR